MKTMLQGLCVTTLILLSLIVVYQWALAIVAIGRRPARRAIAHRQSTKFHVLIPAHNEAASIKETISSLRRQTRPPDEIIVEYREQPDFWIFVRERDFIVAPRLVAVILPVRDYPVFFNETIVVIETVFAVPGMGQLLFTSITSRDYPVVQTITVVSAFLVIVVNLAVDLSYSFLDPRVTYE